jgi:hypothetical protein
MTGGADSQGGSQGGSQSSGSDVTTASTSGGDPSATTMGDDGSGGETTGGASTDPTDPTDPTDSTSTTGSTADCHPLIAEILPSNVGSDDGLEWAKLYNPCPQAVDLSALSLGWGGASFGSAVDLQGSLASGACYVIGGPSSDGTNANPTYDQVHNFNPNLSRDPGGMLLYDVAAGSVNVGTVPLDSVAWGSNSAGYLDPSGAVAAVAIGNPAIEQSLERTDETTWVFGTPSPNACPSF